MKEYNIQYKMYAADKIKSIALTADNKEDAYELATYEIIPEEEGSVPYSSWVDSVKYKDGSIHVFNTFEGKPY